MTSEAATSLTHRAAVARGRRLEYFTLGWNVLEALVAVSAGWIAGSTALIGFGIDSLIESLSGTVLLWRLREGQEGQKRERMALKLVGLSFLILALYVAYDALQTLLTGEAPEASYAGIGLAVASLIVMPLLARAKRKVAATLDSRSLVADARQTDICACLSAILLVGLGVNAAIGWWWADPLAGLIMVPLIAQEGLEGLRGETCCGNSPPNGCIPRCPD